jgi:phage terminase large subunit-like protein
VVTIDNELSNLDTMMLDLETDATLLRDVAPGLDMSKGDVRSLYATLKLMELYEEKLSESGTSKWFTPGTPFGIEHCKKHKLFFDAGKDYYERVFAASNRTGKSLSGAFELACHVTGIYPSWWNGRVFDKPIKAWACGADAKSTRDTAQKELLGPIGAWGTGMIPAELLGTCRMLAGVPGGVDFIEIKHVSGGKSVIAFKNYAQDIKAYYGTAMDVIWLDEECPENIYNECLIRTMTTEGIVYVTFTPLHGLTPLVVKFYAKADLLGGAKGLDGVVNQEGVSNGLEEQEARLVHRKVAKAIINAGWDDAPWLTEDAKRRMLDDTLPHLREARSKGIPAMGSGSIYPIPLADITVDPFPIPDYYERLYALDVGWNKTAVLWAARNPDTDVIYLYDEHYQGESPPAVHAEAIRSRGSWIPGVIDPASRGRSQVDGIKLMTMYKEMLPYLYPAKNEVDSGLVNMYNRIASGKLKVFSTLKNFQREYILYRRDLNGKIVKEHDHLMDALRYIGNNIIRALSRIDSSSSGLGGTYSGTKRYDI